MAPTLASQDCVLVDIRSRAAPRVGALVALRDPEDAERVLLKRVRSLGTETFAVGSDNPADARDSRHFGSVPSDHLIGPATLIFTVGGRLRVAATA